MSDTLVREQGATRWSRASDYGGSGRPYQSGADRRRPLPWDDTGRQNNRDRYRAGGDQPRRWSPIQPNPYRDYEPPRDPRERGPRPYPRVKPKPVVELPRQFSDRFGRKLPRLLGREFQLARRASPYGRLIDYVDYADSWYRGRNPTILIPPGWTLFHDCSKPPATNPGFTNPRAVYPPSINCLAGQAGPRAARVWYPNPGDRGIAISNETYIASGQERHSHLKWYARPDASAGNDPFAVQAVPVVAPAASPRVNPNLMRRLPTTRTQVQVDTATDGALQPPYKGRSYTPTGWVPTRPVKRAPPRNPRREKQSKALGMTPKAMAGLFGLLDVASEYAELVDAFYDALPKPIQYKYKQDSRGLLDTAGQYGIDGADWKLKALWDNWDQVDPDTAVENIVKNLIQDRVLGDIHKALPRNTGSALDDAFKRINKDLNGFLEEYVDASLI